MLILVQSTWLKCPFDPPLVLCPLDITSMVQNYEPLPGGHYSNHGNLTDHGNIVIR